MIIFILISFLFSSLTQAELKKESVHILKEIKNEFDLYYAPKNWKQNYQNWNLENDYNIAIKKTESHLTIRDFHNNLNYFLYQTKDAHVRAQFEDTEKSYLLFVLYKIKNKFYVIQLLKKWSNAYAPLQIGDEVLKIGGVDVLTLYQEQFQALGAIDNEHTKTWATIHITNKFGNLTKPSSGFVDIEFKDHKTNQIKTIQTNWQYKKDQNGYSKTDTTNKKSVLDDTLLDIKNDFTWDYSNGFLPNGHRSVVPYLGPIENESHHTDEFQSYTYKNKDNKKIGYIRIPSFQPKDTLSSITEFRNKIKFLEKETDFLIVDTLSNSGGYLFYKYALLATLTTTELSVPKHKIAMDASFMKRIMYLQNELEKNQSLESLKELYSAAVKRGLNINKDLQQTGLNFCKQITESYENGDKLSPPVYLWGINKIKPDLYATYSKPILVLVNELNTSGGDFFPAILKDNKRALIFGRQTVGAGGIVRYLKIPNNMGVQSISYTGSIAIRSNGNIIEELGVTPDINYHIQVKDLKNNFIYLRDTINQTVRKQLNKN